MQSLDRAGKLGSARTSVGDSECGVPDSGFKGAVIFQKIRDTLSLPIDDIGQQ